MAARKSRTTPSDASNEANLQPPSFEKSMDRLSAIVLELEGGDLSLEESLTRFEEGVRLARTTQHHLDAAEARVEELLGLDEAGPVTREIQPL
jgi:exodeoxyribonuclease VII small subunit